MYSVLFALLIAPHPDAATILTKAQGAILGYAAAYTLRMVVTRPNKPVRAVEMKGFKKGDDLGLVRYTSPPKERGTAYLRNGDSSWLFLPSAEKVIRVGAKQNFGGGDFSNGDIFRLALTRDYDVMFSGEETLEGIPTYRLELKAKDRSVAYDKVVYWVRSDGSFYPARSEYYTISGKRLKSLTVKDVQKLGDRERPTFLQMESLVEEGSRTELRFLSIDDRFMPDDRLFAPNTLEKGE